MQIKPQSKKRDIRRKFPLREVMILMVVLVVSLLVRMIFLSSVLPGFHFDEANAGYNAYSLLKTGKTIWGDSWPIYLNTFGDYRPMAIVYLLVPSIWIFGLSEFAVRFPIALIGAISPLLLYTLANKMTHDKGVATLSAVFLSLSFWHINLSRTTSEAILAVFFAMIILLTSWSMLETGKIGKGALLYLLLIVSFITYHPINLFLPPLLLLLLWIWRKNPAVKTNKRMVLAVIVLYLIFPQFSGIFFGEATGRLRQVADVYSHEFQDQLLRGIVEHRGKLPVALIRAYHNKLLSAGVRIAERYSDYLSGKFLLFKGGLPHRYLIPDVGLINAIEFVGLILFILHARRYIKDRSALIMVAWIFLAIVPASLTSDDHPNMSRAVLMMPAIQFLAAYALVNTYKDMRTGYRIPLVFLMLFVGFFHLGVFLDSYFIHERYDEWLHRNYAARNAARELMNIGKDRKVLATKYFLESDMYILFFQKIDPNIAQAAYASGSREQVSFLNYTFTNANVCATKLDVSEVPTYDVYLDLDYCDEPDWSTVIPILNADGSMGAKIQLREKRSE